MITRRACLLGGAAAAALPLSVNGETKAPDFDPSSPLPHKEAFFPIDGAYLNCASQHPISRGARAAIEDYLDFKTFSSRRSYPYAAVRERILENYATLIGADADEICFVQSTTTGENLILRALGIPDRPARIVTDELHFIGSLPTYSELAKLCMDVETLRAFDDGTIDLEKFDKAINDETTLVALSLVSTINGYRHDLESICELAHARGALVYADVIHAVGSTPFDVRASGVDFASAASYKWLMGDMGLGLMYVRRDRLKELRRPWFGHNQLKNWRPLGFPAPNAGEEITEYEHLDSALGYFAMGTQANGVAAQLDYSLQYLAQTGVERIQAYRQPLIDHLQQELPALGYPSITPADSGTALVSFRHDKDVAELRNRLSAAGITISVYPHHFRVSPSVFNDMGDMETLVRALA